MGAFIGYEKTGVWISNNERDAFLDWFAEHRCKPGDDRFEYCKSEGNRWTGCCIQLEELIPQSEVFELSYEEFTKAGEKYGGHIVSLLSIISEITKGVWQHGVSSREALDWRDY